MKLADITRRGTRSAQPPATTMPVGVLYCVTDEANILERSSGTVWQPYCASGGSGGSLSWASITGKPTTLSGYGITDAASASEVTEHAADTTGVHGIADTTALVLTNDARLSDDRDPTTHAASHQNGGTDEISVAGLSGVLADPQPPIIGSSGTQAVAGDDARLTDARTPTAHASSHQNGNADEINVAGLSGLLADEQTPLTHDIITKHNGFPGGTVNFLRADGTFAAPSTGGVSDGDKGDITVSGSGATWTIDNGAVTLAKQANMATASLVYRKTAGSGAPEVNTLATLKTDLGLTGVNSGDQDLSSYATTAAVAAGYQPLDADLTSIAALTTTAFGRGFLDLADAAAGRTKLSLGTLATQSGTFSGTSSGINSGDQTSIVGITGTIAQFNTACTDADFAIAARNIANGFGITGGGDLSADRTLAVSLTNAQAFVTAETTISAATYADITGASISLAAGTWLILGTIVASSQTTTITSVLGAITDGANAVVAEANSLLPAGTATVRTWKTVTLAAIVTPGATTTYKLRGARGTTTSTGNWIASDGNGLNTANNVSNNSDKATSIRAVRIA